jgi:hypothetical protein
MMAFWDRWLTRLEVDKSVSELSAETLQQIKARHTAILYQQQCVEALVDVLRGKTPESQRERRRGR